MRLRATRLVLQLPKASSRAVALAFGSTVLLCGGLTSSGSTSGSILRLDLSAGHVSTIGRLTAPVHDAGGAVLNGVGFILGGGRLGPGSTVQQVGPMGSTVTLGQLPAIRADLAAVAIDGELVVAGGGTPTQPDNRVLASADGRQFRVVATLLIGVRYPAVAAVDGLLYVIGGSTPAGDSDAIQTVDPLSGAVRIVGHLSHALSHASAVVIEGVLLVSGGRLAGRAQTVVWQINLASGIAKAVGRLPYAVSDAAAVVVGKIGYLIGGEAAAPLTSIISLAFG